MPFHIFINPRLCCESCEKWCTYKGYWSMIEEDNKTKWWSKLSEEATMLFQNKCQTNYANVTLTIVLPNIAINVFSFELHKRCIMLVTLILICMFCIPIWRCYLLPKVPWRIGRLISRNILSIDWKSPSTIML